MNSNLLAKKLGECGNKRMLARLSGVSQRTIWRVATGGHRNIGSLIAEKLVAALRQMRGTS